MSSYGDGTIRTRIQEELDAISYAFYGKEIYDLTNEEKLQFSMQVLDVLHYCMGYDDWEGIIRK